MKKREKFITNLVETIKREFSDPYLPKDFVDIKYDDYGLWLRIGRRDVSIGPDGKSLEAGSLLISEWTIIDNREKIIANLEKKRKGKKK